MIGGDKNYAFSCLEIDEKCQTLKETRTGTISATVNTHITLQTAPPWLIKTNNKFIF